MAIDWSKSYTLKAYAERINPQNWLGDGIEIPILSASVKRSDDNDRQSATIDCGNYTSDKEIWVRLWADVSQGNSAEHVALFTGLTAPTKKNINGTLVKTSLECYSVLRPASDVLLQKGWYAPAEADGAGLIKDLLAPSPAPIDCDQEAPLLKEAIIAEENETNLSMVEKILDAIEWTISIDGKGRIILGKADSDTKIRYDSLSYDVVKPEITYEANWYDCPNVFRVTSGDDYAEARDDSNDSPLSTVNRGREIWKSESSPSLKDDESLSEYAERKLKEAQQYDTKLSYTVRFQPNVNVNDSVYISYPANNIDGTFLITSQTINVGGGLSVSEEAISA